MVKINLWRLVVVAALACGSPDRAVGQSSANYAIPQSTLNAGVGNMSSVHYQQSSSLGDSFFSGPSASADYRMSHGLWTAGVVAPAPVFQSAVSRRAHGAAGTFDMPLSLVTPPAINHNPTTEPRQGPAQTIVFTFDKPLNAATVNVTEGTATAAAPTFAGNSVVVGLTGVTDRQYVTVSLTNVNSTDGGIGGSGTARAGFLVGDVNQSRLVAVTDLVVVNNQLGRSLTTSNFLSDVNLSGIITVLDKVVVNNALGHFLPAP